MALRIFLIVPLVLLSGCVTNGAFASLTDDQRAVLHDECGPYPVSLFRAAESPRKIRYRICRREVLDALRADDA